MCMHSPRSCKIVIKFDLYFKAWWESQKPRVSVVFMDTHPIFLVEFKSITVSNISLLITQH